jgi:hypothetical protein
MEIRLQAVRVEKGSCKQETDGGRRENGKIIRDELKWQGCSLHFPKVLSHLENICFIIPLSIIY